MLTLRREWRPVSLVLWGCLVVLILLVIAGVINYLRPLPAIRPIDSFTPTVSADPLTLSWPTTGEAAVGAVGYGILASHGASTPLPTASVAKLVTCLAVLQKYPLQLGDQGPTITLSAADVTLYQQYLAEDGSVVNVQAGEQITEYEALEAMLLPSANNMADSLAIWAFGSLSAYATYANHMLLSLGLTNTHIGSDASGFLPDTTSDASDLVHLGMDVLQSPVLTHIVAESSAVLPVAGTVHNVNYLLGTDGIIGIKTGNSDQAGGVYLFAATDALDSTHSVTIVGVVQGLVNLQTALQAGKTLLDSTKENFSLATVVSAGQVIGSYNTLWKTQVSAVATNAIQAIVWKGSVPIITTSLKPQKAPLAAGSTIGSITASGATTPVTLQTALNQPPLLWRIVRHNLP